MPFGLNNAPATFQIIAFYDENRGKKLTNSVQEASALLHIPSASLNLDDYQRLLKVHIYY